MSDQDGSIFNGSTPAPETQEQVASNQHEEKVAEASSGDPYADLLQGITSEDGRPKYATVSDALNSLGHSQAHIAKLEAENARFREEFAAMEERMNAEKRHLEPQTVQQDAVLGADQYCRQSKAFCYSHFGYFIGV